MAARLGDHFLKMIGWRTVGEVPRIRKYVAIVAPHTSNLDFLIGFAVKNAMKLRASFIGKHTLFNWPQGVVMRRLGGMPIDRRKQHDTVKQVVSCFRARNEFVLALAPEGTRGRTEHWKSGFYHIAVEAGVPLCLGFLDYRRKEAGLGPMIQLTGNVKQDMDVIRDFYKDKHGRYPHKVGPARIKEEDALMTGNDRDA